MNKASEEVWKPIEGYEGLYEVSDKGNVRSLDRYVYTGAAGMVRRKGVFMKQQTNKKGYKTVMLHDSSRVRSTTVHRLVAEAFIPNPDNKSQVNHIDTDKTNNSVSNLEWNTQEENMAHAKKHNLFKNKTEKQIKACAKNLEKAYIKRRRPVDMYTLDGHYIKTFESIRKASAETNTSGSHITSVCKGYRGSSGGYKWKYTEGRAI